MMNRIRPPCYRYCRLLSALQFEDYDRVGVDKEADRAWKVRRITESLRTRFKGLLSEWGEYIVVDDGYVCMYVYI